MNALPMTSRWLALLALLPGLSFAQAAPAPTPPPPAVIDAGTVKARPTKSKSLGSSKEDEPVVLAAPVTAKTLLDADRGLMAALLFAFEPAPTEVRVQAIEDLGLLGDARGLNPLAQLVLDANPVVQLAAVRAIRNIAHPRAEAILSNVVRHPSVTEAVKVQALDAVLFQNTASSQTFLTFVARGNGFSPALSSAAQRVLSEVSAPPVPTRSSP